MIAKQKKEAAARAEAEAESKGVDDEPSDNAAIVAPPPGGVPPPPPMPGKKKTSNLKRLGMSIVMKLFRTLTPTLPSLVNIATSRGSRHYILDAGCRQCCV
jgi:hypothetical protein